MTATGTDALKERIARALAAQDGFGPEHPDHEVVTGEWSSAAAAVLPIVAEEVRKAKAEALREAAYEFAEGAWADQWGADRVDDDVSAVQSTERWFNARADEIEKENTDG